MIAAGKVTVSLHLASAHATGADLRADVTCDRRMQDATTVLGLVVEAPA